MINLDTRLLDDVNSDQLWLLCHIVKRADNNLSCYPSNKTLCKDCGWNIKKLQRVKSELIERGLLIIKPRADKERQTSNLYAIRTDLLGIFVPAKNLSVLLENEGTPKTDSTPVPDKGAPVGTPKKDNEVLTTIEVLNTSPNGDSSQSELALELPNTTVAKKERDVVYHAFCAVWQKNFPNIGFKFPRDGAKIKSLIDQTKMIMGRMGVPTDDIKVVEFFDIAIANLPDWYRGKTLPVIDSHYPTIIDQITNGPKRPITKNGADRFSDFAGIAQ